MHGRQAYEGKVVLLYFGWEDCKLCFLNAPLSTAVRVAQPFLGNDFMMNMNVAVVFGKYPDMLMQMSTAIEDVVFSTGNIILNRRDIDHILLDDCLDNFHIDAYAFFVDRKAKAIPAIYQPYLYISPMHRILNDYKDPSDLYIKHINKETLRRIHLLIIPIIHNNHWTLLVGRMKERVWKLYDSLPNPQHKDICVTVVQQSVWVY
ncbi:hypothetical protein M5K25_018835 [Dendrobium thyrsiflorum]|uniref:Ubiquitin-like protease family profile domain-containing protein n=1 Tax=Dendrobium thyrsiflorum TaxID=117978 RepID=A0ABD0UK67_DENTH